MAIPNYVYERSSMVTRDRFLSVIKESGKSRCRMQTGSYARAWNRENGWNISEIRLILTQE